MALSSFAVKRTVQEEMSLAITPMADVFTVILVFLLKSFSTGISSLTPTQDVHLPEARAVSSLLDGMKLEISPNGILLNDAQVMKLTQFQFDPKQLAEDGSLKEINDAIRKEKEEKTLAGSVESRMTIVADRKTPYALLKRVFTSTANYDYTDLSLAVVEEQ